MQLTKRYYSTKVACLTFKVICIRPLISSQLCTAAALASTGRPKPILDLYDSIILRANAVAANAASAVK